MTKGELPPAQEKPMKISLIAAVAAYDWAIGKNNTLPWRLPSDLAWFKQYTQGKVVVMGRKTAESLRGPLPKRTNIVVSRNGYEREGFITKASFLDAIDHGQTFGNEIVVIGGSAMYDMAMPFANEAVISWVKGVKVENPDAFFPDTFHAFGWAATESEFVHEEGDEFSYARTIYHKR